MKRFYKYLLFQLIIDMIPDLPYKTESIGVVMLWGKRKPVEIYAVETSE